MPAGEAWQEIMMDCADTEAAKCDSRLNRNDGCGSDIAYPYFISFYVLCSFLVLSNFENVQKTFFLTHFFPDYQFICSRYYG